jgi:CheY-like chemotaxis protein
MDDLARKLRILIVDHCRHCSRTLSHLVRLFGCETRTAHNGAEAVEASTEFRPDFVIIEIGLLGQDGYEVARCIRDQPWSTAIRMIALAGAGRGIDERRFRGADFDHHLTKPIDVEALLSMIGRPRPQSGQPLDS